MILSDQAERERGGEYEGVGLWLGLLRTRGRDCECKFDHHIVTYQNPDAT